MTDHPPSKTKYSWKSGYPYRGVDALTVWLALERLSQENNGFLSPRQVVEAARPVESILHPLFEWDNASAAVAHRLEQAGCLMRSIQVHYEVQPSRIEVVRALQNVTLASERVYVSTIVALKEDSLRQQVINAAFRELSGWTSRYRQYSELAEIVAKIDRLLNSSHIEDNMTIVGRLHCTEAA